MKGCDKMLKPIKGYEGIYEITEFGQVYSCERTGSDGRHLKKKLLKGGRFSNGYEFVCLRKEGINSNKLIHRLVAEAFIPNIEDHLVVNHLDGNIHNNTKDNLEWCSQAKNLKHAVNIGLMESQCKIRRKVTVKQDENIILFDTMKDCAISFGFEKGWLHNQIRRHGCIFNYKGYEIEVHKRGVVL